jgi:hypothetical protein
VTRLPWHKRQKFYLRRYLIMAMQRIELRTLGGQDRTLRWAQRRNWVGSVDDGGRGAWYMKDDDGRESV